MALNQQDIDVGAAPNDGQGDPIRTAFIKCNDNFTQLYSLPNPTPPTTLIGATGDMPGMYAYDDTYFYYCYAPYNGVSTVWGQLVQSDESIPSIGNGLSNVVIAFANADVTIGVNGTGNVGVFSSSGLTVKGAVDSNTITTGSLVSGNFIVAGDTISSLGETITITPAGNVVYGDVVVNASFSILGTITTTEAPVIVLANTAANADVANGAGIQVSQGNFASVTYDSAARRWIASPRLETASLYINSPYGNGNIFGAYNISATNGVFANTVNSNIIIGNYANLGQVVSTSVIANVLGGDGALISNIQGANVIGTVAFAETANFALNSIGTTNANYANFAGTVTVTNQPNITRVGTLTALNVSGNSNVGNIAAGPRITSTGAITAPFLGTANSTILSGTIGVLSNSQPNITSVGTLVELSTGNLSVNGDTTITGNLYAGNIAGNIVASTKYAEFVTSNAQPNITSVGNLNYLSVNTGIYLNSGNLYANNAPAANTVINARNIFGNVIGLALYTVLRGSLGNTSNAQPNITSVGNLISVNVTNNAQFGPDPANTTSINGNTISSGVAGTTLNLGYNVIIPGNLQVQGNTTTVNSNTVAINDLTFVVANNASTSALADGAGLFVGPEPTHYAGLYYLATPNTWNFDIPLAVTGNITSTGNVNSVGVTATGNITTSASISATGNINSGSSINVTGNVYAPSFNWSNGSPVISSSGNLSTSTVNATGNITSTANINAGGATFTGNIDGTNINVTGNVTGAYFNGIATSAEYADLAENYLADAKYIPGTVVSFGGPKEVTVSTEDLDVLVAGVISTNPAYTMNSGLTGDYTTPVALMGRVPCRVTGPVSRGAMMVSNGDGTARAEKNPAMGSVLGKALESFNGSVGVIEIVVGKL